MEKPAKKKFRITESDFLLANRKASREEELERHGKQIIFRTSTQKSKKVYDRERLKKADINDDLPFSVLRFIHMRGCTQLNWLGIPISMYVLSSAQADD